MGNAAGAVKAAAARLGMTVDEYLRRIAEGQKRCTACKAWHARSAFGSDRSRPDGLDSSCLNSRVVAKSGRPGARERRQKAAYGLAWCRGCAIWLPLADVNRNGVCRTHAAEEGRAHYAANPVPIRRRKIARARGLAPIPEWWREETFEGFNGLCAYGCSRPATAMDHVHPVVKGGESCPTNLVPACASCNSSKKDADPAPWIDKGLGAFPDQWDDLLILNFHFNGPLDGYWDEYPAVTR